MGERQGGGARGRGKGEGQGGEARGRGKGERQGGGGTIVHLFSAKVSALYQLTVKFFLQK